MEIKRLTNKELMLNIFNLVRKNGHYDKAEKIIDYFLPESMTVREITNCEFDFCADVNYGKSEGIYVDCYIKGNFDENNQGNNEILDCGTFKTLSGNINTMKIMGELCGSLVFYGRKYVNQNLDSFMPKKK